MPAGRRVWPWLLAAAMVCGGGVLAQGMAAQGSAAQDTASQSAAAQGAMVPGAVVPGARPASGMAAAPFVAAVPLDDASGTPKFDAPASPPATAEPAKAGEESAVSSVGAAQAAAAHASTASTVLQREIAGMPPLLNTGIHVEERSAEILAHLNGILRFYRTAATPAQKVGEPSDTLYQQQSAAQATQIAQLAFEASKDEALLLAKVGGPGLKTAAPQPAAAGAPSETQRLATLQQAQQAKFAALQAQQSALTQQLAKARGAARTQIETQLQNVGGALELQHAMLDALSRLSSFSGAETSTGLVGSIDRLQRSAPELLSTGAKTPAPGVIESIAGVHGSGVTTQAETLFSLLGTLRTIDQQTAALGTLSKQAADLRLPFIKVLRATMAQGQTLLEQGAAASAAPAALAGKSAGPSAAPGPPTATDTRKQFDTLTSTFQDLADAMMPLNQEAVLLDNARGVLTTWRAAVEVEQRSVLRDLLVRVFLMAAALGILAVLSDMANRVTVRYVGDLRRRRQLLFVRRAVTGFLSGLVLVFGFVTQFSSLATFAGFISAGIAVGLQSILLSVAAYFFIVGRYGVRVGDRITVAGVTGEVIEVGLVRFYMMELVGTGTELHSTGRVAVFANSILFQTGTPIYKQMPGTEYAWHELTAKLAAGADVPAVTQLLKGTVDAVFAGYSAQIQAQHQQVEAWMGTAIPLPKIESRLQLADGGLQYAVLFPVEISNAATADQQIAERLVAARAQEPLKSALTELPVIKAAVKS